MSQALKRYIFNTRVFTLAQIHAALTYYYGHRDEFDAEIMKQLKEVEALMGQSKRRRGDSNTARILRG